MMNWYDRTLQRLSTTAWFRWLLSKVLTPLDLKLRNTPFAPSSLGTNLPLCYLTTTGAVSGEPRTVPLLFLRDDGTVLVSATNFGRDRHPAWSFNLDKTPRAVLEIDGTSRPVSSDRLSQDEVTRYWPAFDDIWPGYDTYRAITERDIKMYRLTAVPL